MKGRLWALPTALSIFLVVVAQYDFLTFHTLAEFFAITVSLAMFAFAWTTFEFSRNSFLLFLASGYFWIGSLDLAHTLVYEGMSPAVSGDANVAIQLWVGTRFLEALLLLVAPLFARRELNKSRLLTLFGVIAVCLTIFVFSGHFPTAFVEGTGLTDFKINSEYVIDGILFVSLITLFYRGSEISNEEKSLIALSIVFTMCAELAFTFYVSLYGLSNLVGHILKLFSYWFIFQAIVAINLKKPYADLLNEKRTSTRHLAQIQEQEDRLEAIFNSIPDGIVVADMDNHITSVNRGMEKLFGHTENDLAGRDISVLFESEEEFQRQDQIRFDDQPESNGRPYEVLYHRKDGEIFYGETLGSEIKGRTGELIGFIRVIRDVSEQKYLEAQLRRSQKMEAIGQLTGGLAHDFNNILGIVMGNLEIVKHMISNDEKATGRIDVALAGVKRGADLTRKLLGFSRKETLEARPTSANEIVLKMEELLVGPLTAAINVERYLADDLWLVEVNAGDLQDAIVNLAINARDAMPEGGSLVFETQNKVLDTDYLLQNPAAAAGEFVMISVSDTGHGMTSEIKEKALDPFFSTKETAKGTGLGLSMVYGFVQRSGGHMQIFSEPGEGTTVQLYLPRISDRKTSEAAEKGAQADLPRGDETILVVDDEETMVDVAVAHLEALGYRTLTANSGIQALKALQDHPDIVLLFSDVVMPGKMNGYRLATEALKARPDLKVLLTSGFTGRQENLDDNEDAIHSTLAATLLDKPYTHIGLATAIRHALDQSDKK